MDLDTTNEQLKLLQELEVQAWKIEIPKSIQKLETAVKSTKKALTELGSQQILSQMISHRFIKEADEPVNKSEGSIPQTMIPSLKN